MAGQQRTVPAPFLTKTYELVDDSGTDDVVSWNENGTAFVVWKMAEFAKDLLPNYFKHNNFSSFVRQLNTYGFRKVVPDKWEFANEHFRRGQKELLSEIRRRKSASQPPAAADGKSGSPSSQSNSDIGSSSTSSPGSKNPSCVDTAANGIADLNEKLRRENKTLNAELTSVKRRCEELVAFLTERMKVRPGEVERIMKTCGENLDVDLRTDGEDYKGENDSVEVSEEGVGGPLKLFGVWLKGDKKKRDREDNFGTGGSHATLDFHAPLLKSSKVCN